MHRCCGLTKVDTCCATAACAVWHWWPMMRLSTCSLDEFVSQQTSSYIGQQDVHIAELSVSDIEPAVRCMR